MSDQIEFSSFFVLLHSIKEGDSEKNSLLDEKMNQFKKGEKSKNYLEEIGSIYLYIGISELYNFTNKKDLKSIGLIDKEGWINLASDKEEELPIFLSNKMIKFIKENNKIKEIAKKWNVREREIKKHITPMARYITEGIIDVIE